MELWDYERQAWNSGAETVCGVDEAGAYLIRYIGRIIRKILV